MSALSSREFETQAGFVNYRTDPSNYSHWRVSYDGPVATLTMDVQEDAGIRLGYKLKLNSYDLGGYRAALLPATEDFGGRIRLLPGAARKLLCVIARQAYHGSLRSKGTGIATMPEVHEACGLDVEGMYSVLEVLREGRLIELEGEYPFEEIRLTGDGIAMETILRRCEAAKAAIEDVVTELRFGLLK